MTTETVQYGAKATGLSRLPKEWTPRYECFALPTPTSDTNAWTALADLILNAFAGLPIILRSSAATETLADRGRFESYPLEVPTTGAVVQALRKLHDQGANAETQMAVVAQVLKRPVVRGHLSNERRVSKTRNQWEVEVDYPYPDDYRANSQRDAAPATGSAIRLRGNNLRRTLGAIGHWAAANFESRVHMEWVYDHDCVWIVQLDLEDEAPDHGVDPRNKERVPGDGVPSGAPAALLQRWSEGSFSGFRKIETLADFVTASDGGFPSLFVLCGEDAAAFLDGPDPERALRETVGDRLVGRCDILPETREGFDGLNLPRTDTVSPTEIVVFIRETLEVLADRGAPSRDVILIFHAFIPAITAAWAEAEPGEAIVQVDALWGLPDGLQYLDCDVFEYDISAGVLRAEHVPYKNAFLCEDHEGKWSVETVRRDIARTASMSREDVADVARATHNLARMVGHRLRVMWFVDIQGRPDLARSIPWFCHKPEDVPQEAPEPEAAATNKIDRSEMRRRPVKVIAAPNDLRENLAQPHRLKLMPTIEHMRDNAFLENVAAYANSGRHAVELRGSGLAHAYYLLGRESVPIVAPSHRMHLRTRGLRTFGKLVRDGIPDKIKSNNEEVVTMTLLPDERRRMLLAKLMEEAQEVVESTNRDDLRSELADVQEVLQSLIRHSGFDVADIEKVAEAKAARLGSFDKGVVLLDTHAANPKGTRARRRSSLNARPVRDGNTITIPHMAIIGDSVELTIGRCDVRVSLTTDGLVLEELGPQSDDGQLKLNLPELEPSVKSRFADS